MSREEDLYRELAEQEEEDDMRYHQARGGKEMKKIIPKQPDPVAAQKRYDEEIKPVLEARRRVQEGLPPTDNPLRNAWLKITGQDKIVERPGFQIVEPSKGLVLDGPTVDEVQKEIAANPEKYPHLQKHAPTVRPVMASKREASNIPPPR